MLVLSKRTTAVKASSASVARRSSRTVVRSAALSSRVAISSWDDSRQACAGLASSSPQLPQSSNAPRRKAVTMMGNKATGGPFAPLVVVVRNVMGDKPFNQLRGKAIALHSQVIKDVLGKTIGVDNKQVQGVIRLAKKNGEWLGFLA